MNAALFVAEVVDLGANTILTGGLFLLGVAGPPETRFMRRWEARVLAWAFRLALTALGAAVAVLALQTAALDTRFAALWTFRAGLLLLLALWLYLGGAPRSRMDWFAARGEAALLAAGALVAMSGVSHAAANWDSAWSWSVDAAHLLGAALLAGALPALAVLLWPSSRLRAGPDPQAVRTLRRFARVALAAVVVLALSGLAGAWLLIGDFAGLVATTHGRLLLAKLAVLLVALLVAASARALSGAARQVAKLVAAEAALALVGLGLAAAMRATPPAVAQTPAWPWTYRIAFDSASGALLWLRFAPPPAAAALAFGGLGLLAAVCWTRRRTLLLSATLAALGGVGAAVALRPSLAPAFPTSFARSPVAYSAASIAEGMAAYQTQCASCHGTPSFDGVRRNGGPVELLSTEAALRSAGDLFGAISQGDAAHGMPGFAGALSESQRWSLVNFLRALADAGFCAAVTSRVGDAVEPDKAWLAAPDVSIAVGRLTPTPLRDLRGKRMALLVLYAWPGSRARLAELARHYGALSVLGLEIVAVPERASRDAIAELGQAPPVQYPVVTEGNEAVHAAFRLFAPGVAHAELLIDRQGYIRAIWRDATALPDVDVIEAQVEKLNAERAPPPPPDDHIH